MLSYIKLYSILLYYAILYYILFYSILFIYVTRHQKMLLRPSKNDPKNMGNMFFLFCFFTSVKPERGKTQPLLPCDPWGISEGNGGFRFH